MPFQIIRADITKVKADEKAYAEMARDGSGDAIKQTDAHCYRVVGLTSFLYR